MQFTTASFFVTRIFWKFMVSCTIIGDRSPPGHKESWWKLIECRPATQNADGSWQKVSLPHAKLTEGVLATWKVHRSWWNISRPNGKLTKVDEMSPGAQNVDGSCRKVYLPQGNLTDFNGTSPDCTKSWRKVSGPYRKFTEDDKRCSGHVLSWRKLTEDLLSALRVAES